MSVFEPARMRVAVVGMGGLGCPATLALAHAGVRHLTLLDDDCVDLSNLHRQPWHGDGDVGKPKVDSAERGLRGAFPQLAIQTQCARVDPTNVDALFQSHDWVVDATDSMEAKFLLSDSARRNGGRLVYGGVVRTEGQVMVVSPTGPCLRCLFEELPDVSEVPTCAAAGVMGALAGVVGALQVQVMLREAERPSGSDVTLLHILDGWSMHFRQVRVHRNSACGICSGGPPHRDAA